MESKSLLPPECIVYGGAFDPPHEGHRLVIKRVLAGFPGATVKVIPGKMPAGVQGKHKLTGASFEQRLAMCRLMFEEELASGRVELDTIERELPTPNYTVQTLRALQSREPKRTLGLVMGRDQLQQFASWKEPSAIVEMASLVIVDRDEPLDFGVAIDTLGTQLKLHPIALPQGIWLWEVFQTGIFPLAGLLSEASSSKVRKDIGAARTKGWLTEHLADFIESQGLYKKVEA